MRDVVLNGRSADVANRGCNLHPRFGTIGLMSRVIQVRNVPDEVHDALVEAARAQGLSLTTYMLHELEHLARRAEVVYANAVVARETQAVVRGRIDRDSILTAVHEGRGD